MIDPAESGRAEAADEKQLSLLTVEDEARVNSKPSEFPDDFEGMRGVYNAFPAAY